MPPANQAPSGQQQHYAMLQSQQDMHQGAVMEAAMQAAVMFQNHQATLHQQHALMQQQRMAMIQQYGAAATASQQYGAGPFNLPQSQQKQQAAAPFPLSNGNMSHNGQGGYHQGLSLPPSESLSFLSDDLHSGCTQSAAPYPGSQGLRDYPSGSSTHDQVSSLTQP
jgi:hypothetical protein